MKRLCSPTQFSRLGRNALVCAFVLSPMSEALAAPVTDPAAPAEVAPAEDAPSTTDKAVSAFEAGDFDAAIELFEQAYVEEGDPNYLFNIGRVFEEKGDLRSAIDRYEKFVNSAGVDLESREFANESDRRRSRASARRASSRRPRRE